MEEGLERVIFYLMQLDEYKRKQVIAILTASMLSKMSQKEAKKVYDKTLEQINQLIE